MSSYVREKVLRIPFDKLHKEQFCETFDMCDPCWRDSIDKHPLFDYSKKSGCFQVSPTEEFFIDYVIDQEQDADEREWGKTRMLSEREQRKYYPIFQKIDPNINMNLVHLVEYCWYNCSEAPGYYDLTTHRDPFYEEI